MNAEEIVSPGTGEKRCPECQKIVASARKKCDGEDCGHTFETKSKSTGASGRKTFAGVTKDDWKMALSLIESIRRGVDLSKPDGAKPTAEDFVAAIGDDDEQAKLAKQLEQWKVYDSSSSLDKKTRKRLSDAVKEFDGQENEMTNA